MMKTVVSLNFINLFELFHFVLSNELSTKQSRTMRPVQDSGLYNLEISASMENALTIFVSFCSHSQSVFFVVFDFH